MDVHVVVNQFLQLVEHVAVQETKQGPVDVQGICSAEPGEGKEREDVFERAQNSERSKR